MLRVICAITLKTLKNDISTGNETICKMTGMEKIEKLLKAVIAMVWAHRKNR